MGHDLTSPKLMFKTIMPLLSNWIQSQTSTELLLDNYNLMLDHCAVSKCAFVFFSDFWAKLSVGTL